MKFSDVPIWLKTLRLHKYTPLLASMSYEQMMQLNDEQLEQLQVRNEFQKGNVRFLDE